MSFILRDSNNEMVFLDERKIKVGRYEIVELTFTDGSSELRINGELCKPEYKYLDAVSACMSVQASENAAKRASGL